MSGFPTMQGQPNGLPLQLGRFEVLGRVAVGGMSEIFLAHEQLYGEPLRRVAIKLLRSGSKGTRAARAEALFAREARTLLRLDHPNICHSYELGQLAGRIFIAMEWVDGLSLRELMLALHARGERLPIGHAVNLVAQVAAGLQHAHTARDAYNEPLMVVHRDVNPTNIMVRYDGVVKLIDFGVAQAVESAHAPISEQIEGKLSYMAPEQIRGEPLDARADIFALGVCLFEIVTGTRLYRRRLPEQVRTAVLLGDVPSARSVSPAVPVELDAIIQLALQKDPTSRFQQASAMQEALEEFLRTSNLPMGARPLAALMEPLLRARPASPVLAPSAELEQLVLEHVALTREPTGVRVLRPPHLPRDNDAELSPLEAERSGARAVGARPSDHAALKPRPRRPLLRVALAVAAGLTMGVTGFLLSEPAAPQSVASSARGPVPDAPAAAAPASTPSLVRHDPHALLPVAAQTAPPPVTAPATGQPGSGAKEGALTPRRALQPGTLGADASTAARALFQEGVVLAARGQYRAAIANFARADALAPTPATTIHWASALQALAHFAEAYQRLSTLERLDPGQQLPPELARRAGRLQSTLEASVTRLTIELPDDAVDMHVRLDRLHVPPAELGRVRGLTPGRHHVEVQRAGQPQVEHVLQTAPGELLRLKIAADASIARE